MDDKLLAKKIWKKERCSTLNGLFSEVKVTLEKFNITMKEMEAYSKNEWKLKIRKEIEKKNAEDLKKMFQKYTKINVEEITKENFEMKEYMKNMTYERALIKFKLRARVCETIKTHFKSQKEFEEDIYSCWDCSSEFLDTSTHIKNCKHYNECKESLDLEDTEDLVTFFQRVIRKREQEEDDKETRN